MQRAALRAAGRRLSSFAPFTPASLAQISLAPGAGTEGLLVARAAGYEALDVSVDAGVATVLLNRPQKQNALNMAMWGELIDCFASASSDPTVRAAILAGSGGHFCSGMDLSVFALMKELAAAEPCEGRTREQLLRGIEFFQAGVSAPERCTKPVLCAIEGNAIGGGVDLLTACDLRYCTRAARISVKEIDLAALG